MKKRMRFHLLIVSLLILMISGCSEKSDTKSNTEDKYLGYNKTIEKYVLALVEKDYYTMSQYLSESDIQGDINLENVTKEDEPKSIETRNIMGDRYAIYGFDYFYQEYGEMYYLIEYYNFEYVNNKKELLVLGVKKEGNKFIVFNKYGRHIEATHFKEITNDNNYVTPTRMKSIIDNHPENSFVVKEYPK